MIQKNVLLSSQVMKDMADTIKEYKEGEAEDGAEGLEADESAVLSRAIAMSNETSMLTGGAGGAGGGVGDGGADAGCSR